MILKSELNAWNKITAIGALAVPVLRYSFGIINWRIEEIKKIDRKTRKMLTMYYVQCTPVLHKRFNSELFNPLVLRWSVLNNFSVVVF